MSASDIVKEWLRYALNDLIVAKHSSFVAIIIQCAHLNPYGVAVRMKEW